MKNLTNNIFAVVLMIAIGFGTAYVLTADASPQESIEQPKQTTCPDGTYQIGYDEEADQPICKNEPTGCPYGDSIPVDSPKCAPPKSNPQPEEKTPEVKPDISTPPEHSCGK